MYNYYYFYFYFNKFVYLNTFNILFLPEILIFFIINTPKKAKKARLEWASKGVPQIKQFKKRCATVTLAYEYTLTSVIQKRT